MSSASRGLAPREGLECLLMKMGRTRPLVEPCRGPQAGKSGDPRSQNADRGKAAGAWHGDWQALLFIQEQGLKSSILACLAYSLLPRLPR